MKSNRRRLICPGLHISLSTPSLPTLLFSFMTNSYSSHSDNATDDKKKKKREKIELTLALGGTDNYVLASPVLRLGCCAEWQSPY